MTPRGPFQPLLFCDSVILWAQGHDHLPTSCWPHYSWYKPGCCWPSWPPGHAAGSCSAGCWPTSHSPFLPGRFPSTPPQACSIAWGCFDQSTRPSTEPCWTSYSGPRPIDPVCPDPSAEPSYPQAHWYSRPVWCHLKTYRATTQLIRQHLV